MWYNEAYEGDGWTAGGMQGECEGGGGDGTVRGKRTRSDALWGELNRSSRNKTGRMAVPKGECRGVGVSVVAMMALGLGI